MSQPPPFRSEAPEAGTEIPTLNIREGKRRVAKWPHWSQTLLLSTDFDLYFLFPKTFSSEENIEEMNCNTTFSEYNMHIVNIKKSITKVIESKYMKCFIMK